MSNPFFIRNYWFPVIKPLCLMKRIHVFSRGYQQQGQTSDALQWLMENSSVAPLDARGHLARFCHSRRMNLKPPPDSMWHDEPLLSLVVVFKLIFFFF